MIATMQASHALADDLAATLGDLALVTTDAAEASAAVTSGTPAVVVPAPTLANAHPAVTLTWDVPMIGAPVSDTEAAWAALDALLTALDTLDAEWEDARPITWGGSQTTEAPAYLVTIRRTISK